MTTSARPRLLYVAFYFPPTRASGVYRSRATANYFARAGWDVTVVTPQREFFIDAIRSYDPSLEGTVDPRVRVDRVRFPAHEWEQDLQRLGWFRANFATLGSKLDDWVNGRLFPERYARWIPHVVTHAVREHRTSPYDLVLATGNPHASFGAAWALNRTVRLPYVVDYRDSWTLDLFEDRPAFPPGHPAWRWEQRILSRASRIAFVNEALREWHAGRYPGAAARMTVLQNGWEPELLGEVHPPRGPAEGPLTFGYLGTVTSKVPLAEFSAGWRLARSTEPVLAGARAKFYGHLGYFPRSAASVREALPLDEGIGVTYEGPVPKTDVSSVYAGLDALLLIIAGSKYVMSGKVYEYMASGRPIVSVHDPACAATEPLKGYPLWFPVRDLTAESVAAALTAAATAARSLSPEDVAACRSYAMGYTRDAQLAPFEQALRSLVRP